MILSTAIPPIYEECRQKFGVKWSDGIVIAYGDTIYCRNTLSPDVIAHEEVHLRQQAKIGKDVWWRRYLDDADFRLSQEKEAYIAQSKWYKKNVKDRELRFQCIDFIARDLSSSMYGNIITKEEAWNILK